MSHRTIRTIIEEQEPVTAPATLTVSEAARLMRERRIGAIMVLQEDTLAGIFTERDALIRVLAEGRDVQTTRLADVMTRNPKTIHPDRSFAEALQMMYGGSFRHVPVVEDGRPVGMVSARDALGPELEAFVYEMLRQEQIGEILA
ncbi:MAG: inosine-5-monophosphate dehydrogenase [Betaproteobacteria bacterium RIFCSPLOWO2_02_64_14]|nr:CBS domain-containing protein [Betaproteobacteria bacterium]OGA02353.1 MAG: inosine-5-monophosphate dehydrogenase [Betaproteobacteria bacterium RIFCSPLOWO2_02_64_14]